MSQFKGTLKKWNLKNLLRRHQKLMTTHPMLMNSVQTSLLMTAGDITAQELVEKKGNLYDPMRTARMATIGLMLGPAITLWYRGLDRMFGSEMTMRSALMKVAFVEVFLTPPGLAGILVIDAILEDKPIVEVLKKKFLRMLLANYIYWPTCSFAIFRFSPSHSRVLWTTTLSFGWNVLMTWMINTDVRELTFKRGSAQVLTDQAVFAPFAIAVVLMTLSLMEGHDPIEKVEQNYVQIMKIHYIFWPPFNFFVFKFVQGDIRTVVGQTAGLFWNTFLCWAANKDVGIHLFTMNPDPDVDDDTDS